MIAEVKSVKRTSEDGIHATDVIVDRGGDDSSTADYYEAPGLDCPPLPGDMAHLADSEGSGGVGIIGVNDGKNAKKAKDGEFRAFARDPKGIPVSEFWLKGDGTVEITGFKCPWKIVGKADGTLELNGFAVDKDGNAKAPGEITAMTAAGPGVTLSKHQHGTGVGPTTPPTPGT